METKALLARFREAFGADAAAVYSAAGRVNLIGEHIDYCGGRVLPAALSLRCAAAVRKNGKNLLRIAATTIDARAEIDLGRLDGYRDLAWGNYQAGVAWAMREEGYSLPGLDILYDCDVPFGAGLSSSAAIEVVTAYAFAAEGGGDADKTRLALLCQRAENLYAGVNCGIMDQFASANGKKNCAVLLDCEKVSAEYVPLDLGEYVLVLANCNKPHSLVESKYNERRAEVEEALAAVRRRRAVTCLAQATGEMLEEAKGDMRPVVYRRAKHVVEECARVEESVLCLKKGDLVRFGQLLRASHASLRDLYEVTGRELDALAAAANGREECLGSRMTGAGFGGSTVSIVRKEDVPAFEKAVGEAYEREIGYAPSFFVAEVEDGIRTLYREERK